MTPGIIDCNTKIPLRSAVQALFNLFPGRQKIAQAYYAQVMIDGRSQQCRSAKQCCHTRYDLNIIKALCRSHLKHGRCHTVNPRITTTDKSDSPALTCKLNTFLASFQLHPHPAYPEFLIGIILTYKPDILLISHDHIALIKRCCGRPFQELQQELRLQKAAKLLISSDATIDEIVSAIGYSEKSYFYRTFKKKYGLTPKEFRKASRLSFAPEAAPGVEL